MEEKKRLIYPDLLRIISIFSVLVLHAVGEIWGDIPIQSKSWVALVAIDGMFRFAVPVFIMVSGMFMLSPQKDRGIKELYSKKVLRIITAFIFWSLVYTFFHLASGFVTEGVSFKPDFQLTVNRFLLGEYHLWFMYMIAGLYIVTPLLRKIVEKKSTMQYFIFIWFIFCIVANFTGLIPVIGNKIYGFIDLFKISIAVQYSGYYVLGYYLHNYTVKKPIKTAVYFLAILGTLGIVGVTVFTSFRSGETVSKYLGYLLPMTAFQSAALFLFFRDKFEDFNPSKKVQKAIFILSKISFGIYLSHILVMKTVEKFCHMFLPLPPYALFGALLISAAVISPLISYLLNRIPGASKYIV